MALDVLTQILEKTTAMELHLKDLNGKVSKHNSWINRYDIRVGEDMPDLEKKVDNMNWKIALGAGVIIAAQFFIPFLLK